MKKIKFYMLFASLVTLMACQKDDIIYYEGPDAVSIYIDVAAYEVDSTSYSFGLELPEVVQDTVWVKVRVQGTAKSYDRTIELKAITGTTATEGEDFELPKFILKANEVEARYPVILYRTERLQENTEKVIVAIKANADFEEAALGEEIGETESVAFYTIYFNDFLSEPAYWSTMYFDYYIGDFSVVKFQFMVSVYGITDFSVWSDGEILNAALNLRNALAEYEAENGILYDEDGNRVTF
ncbi:DUF4843 domain-containing protein [Sphingobacterium sp. UBA6645]|uniref:DUF4843 domain-containing protein n=1 Tax=Sphingobacterium sp. UBA6645 TaxID=1947511 RepID=UPI0025D3D473|nr:DUF4843 domain-containing protein [Sphingobacterium sp. UBA6645]